MGANSKNEHDMRVCVNNHDDIYSNGRGRRAKKTGENPTGVMSAKTTERLLIEDGKK